MLLNLYRRRVRKIGGKFLTFFSLFDHLTASKMNKVEDSREILVGKKDNLCLYVTFMEEVLNQTSLQLVSELEGLGFRVVHINNVAKSSIRKNAGLDSHFQRRNYGYDLAAFKDAFMMLNGDPRSLLLLNSSIFYMHGGIKKLINESRLLHSDVIGITESKQTRQHIQSYFFYSETKRGVEALRSAYSQMRNWRSKRATVYFGELRLKSNLERFGASTASLVPYDAIVTYALKHPSLLDKWVSDELKRGTFLNPTQHLWRILFELNIPIIKKNLISSNPAKLKSRPGDFFEAQNLYSAISQGPDIL